MRETRVGVRELKSKLSKYLREVKAGRTFVITEHDKPIARVLPEPESVEERMRALARAGVISWNGKRLGPAPPAPRVRGKRTVADMLIEDRE